MALICGITNCVIKDGARFVAIPIVNPWNTTEAHLSFSEMWEFAGYPIRGHDDWQGTYVDPGQVSAGALRQYILKYQDKSSETLYDDYTDSGLVANIASHPGIMVIDPDSQECHPWRHNNKMKIRAFVMLEEAYDRCLAFKFHRDGYKGDYRVKEDWIYHCKRVFNERYKWKTDPVIAHRFDDQARRLFTVETELHNSHMFNDSQLVSWYEELGEEILDIHGTLKFLATFLSLTGIVLVPSLEISDQREEYFHKKLSDIRSTVLNKELKRLRNRE